MNRTRGGSPTSLSSVLALLHRYEPALWILAGILLLGVVAGASRALADEASVSAVIVDALESAAFRAGSALRAETHGPDPYNRAYLAENVRVTAGLMELAAGPRLSPAAARGLARYASFLVNESVAAEERLEVADYLVTTLKVGQLYLPRQQLRAAVGKRLREMLETYEPSEGPGAP